VKYGEDDNPKHILIDGGPGGVYRDHLRSELEQIKNYGGQIDLVVLSHIDGDHIVGLLDLTEELKENSADGTDPLIEVKELWANTFSNTISKGNNLKNALQNMLNNVNNVASTMPSGNLALQSIRQGDNLRRNALILDIPLNSITNQEMISYDSVNEPVEMDNIKLKIVGPNEENLEKLREEWHEWIRKNEPNVLTTDQELLSKIDRSVPNLSSIMFLLEGDGNTILFTGDGRGDFILEGLQKAGLMDEGGTFHVDVFKAPHHGSIRNTTKDFFKKVTAYKYVISGDGRHHNPGFETLSWIVECAHEQGRNIELICTNKTKETKKIETEFPATEYGYQMRYLPKDAHSMDVTF
jgi:beta-lactamase superfamily II metal-dependent hydrolase